MNTSRNHLMHCLARQVGAWSEPFQRSWLKQFGANHTPELTEWLRVNANKERARLRQVAQEARDEARRLVA